MHSNALLTTPVDFDPFAETKNDGYALPLTEPQKEMWAAAQMGADASCAYNQCFVLTLRGTLSVESMQTALEQVIARHDALRVTIDENGEYQHIGGRVQVPLPLIDLSERPAQSRLEEIERILHVEAGEPLDLRAGPPLRTRLIREAPDFHRLVVTVHHIVCDGWSSAVFLSDLGRVYAADSYGLRPQLPAVSSYRDYVIEEIARGHGNQAREDEDYWAQQYADSIPVLDLPSDRPRSRIKSYNGAREVLHLDGSLCRGIKSAGAKHGCTLFVTLLAAFEVLLSRLSGQEDFVVGIPMAGQALLDNSHLTAHCVNLLPLRCRIDQAASFAEHLTSVRRAFLDGQSHQRLTFGSLVRRLRLFRDPSRTPLVSVTFNIDRIGAPFDFGALRLEAVESAPKRFVNFDLSVNVVDNGRDLTLECDYNSDLYCVTTIKRWLNHYRVALQAISAGGARRIGELPLLTEAEWQQAISGWNTSASYPTGLCVHERFEQQVARTPQAVALICEDQKVSYAELNRRANRLAHRLRRLGVGPDQLVGLRVGRSIEMVVGILGILKAGGAYLPLDPAYPGERVAFMLEDSSAGVVVTQQALAADLGALSVEQVILDASLDEPDTDPETVATADNLVYAIYTSGSTGKPKGVLITHHNLARLFDATEPWYRFDEHDVWALFHSFAFDFSVWELWGALLYGGRVVIVPYWTSRSPEAFRELLVRERVTVLNQTPSAFRQLVQADLVQPKGDFALRYVIFGGEALELRNLKPWFERYGDVRPQLVNMYGITETTVHVTYRPIRDADVAAGQGSVIGVPIPDLQVYILDGYGAPAPIGVPGEIYVGGAGVARGYLDRPQLTEARFIPDPFRANPGARLYRTGDMARRLSDGDIEYLGRLDNQVKIRGFRIEVGEIEASILKHPAVRQVAVVAREDMPGEKRLVAYFVAENPTAELVDQLRSCLRTTMPEYMIPTCFVQLASLPLTHNGKLDRRALPPPDAVERLSRPPPVAPRTPTEEIVAKAFGDVLARSGVGIHDNFFDLGGDSMMAARLMARLRANSGLDLNLRILFERPTVARMAEAIDALSLQSISATAAAEDPKRERIEL